MAAVMEGAAVNGRHPLEMAKLITTGWQNTRVGRVALGKYIILFASVLHFIWAALLCYSDSAGGATPVHILMQVFGGRWRTAFVLAAVAAAAIVFPFLRHNIANPKMVLMLLPQQLVLLMSAGAGIYASAVHHYADGIPRGWPFILADQLPIILAAMLYTVAILEAAFDQSETPIGAPLQ
jgi:hypothetical protein